MFISYDAIFLGESTLTHKEREKMDKDFFGLPKERKYPLTDKNHVIKAVQFFHYCPDEDKEELAKNILERAKDFGITIHNEEIKKYE